MLHSIKHLCGKKIEASGDRVGHLADCYFDEENWAVRYFAADTDWWTPLRRVFLSPHAFDPIPERGRTLPLLLTVEQIEKSPSLDLQRPVTRQSETDYYRYYDWPFYWQGGCLWGPSDTPTRKQPVEQVPQAQADSGQFNQNNQLAKADRHLRSARSVLRFPAYSGADAIGRVTDFLIDDKNWRIRYLEINVGWWFSLERILVSTRRISAIDWDRARVNVIPTKEAIKRIALRWAHHGYAAVFQQCAQVL